MTSTVTVEAHGEDLSVEWSDYVNEEQKLDDGTVIKTNKYTVKRHVVRDGARMEFHVWDPSQDISIQVIKKKDGHDR